MRCQKGSAMGCSKVRLSRAATVRERTIVGDRVHWIAPLRSQLGTALIGCVSEC